MSSLCLDAVSSNGDGVTAAAATSGTPNGAIKFYAARTPVYTTARPIKSIGTGQSRQVAFDHTGLWYLWAVDDDGPIAVPLAVWINSGAAFDFLEVGDKLRQILEDNRPGLQAALDPNLPGATLGQVLHGFGAEIKNYPAIVIGPASISERYVAFPWTREQTYTVPIAAVYVHEDETPQIRQVKRLGRAISIILSQPSYESFPLQSTGSELNFGFCREVRAEESPIENRFVATATVLWSGMSIYLDPP